MRRQKEKDQAAAADGNDLKKHCLSTSTSNSSNASSSSDNHSHTSQDNQNIYSTASTRTNSTSGKENSFMKTKSIFKITNNF